MHEIDQARIRAAVRDILEAIGEDPEREGLRATPDRVARMYAEIFDGMDSDPREHLQRQFTEDGHNEMVIVRDIPFASMCEHHMMPFFGKYWFAYIPNPKGKILGISKVGRVVDYCAARLQIQERLAQDIVDMIRNALGDEYPPLAIGVVLEGEHLCKTMRGVKKQGKMRSSFYFDNGGLPELKDELSQFVSFG